MVLFVGTQHIGNYHFLPSVCHRFEPLEGMRNMKLMKNLLASVVGGLMVVTSSLALATDNKVVVAYQTDALPFQVGIANGDFAKTTGYQIDFRKFN